MTLSELNELQERHLRLRKMYHAAQQRTGIYITIMLDEGREESPEVEVRKNYFLNMLCEELNAIEAIFNKHQIKFVTRENSDAAA